MNQLTKNEHNRIFEELQDEFVHQLIESQVEQTPDAIAVVFEDRQLTYRELNIRANQLAHCLRKYQVGPEVLVGISLERSLESVVSILGILKAGGAYLFLDPTYPKDRLAFILEDTQVGVLLTQEHLLAKLPEHEAKVICLDSTWEVIAQESEENLASRVTDENLAYVMYTSGSTGKPKGVSITHANVRDYVQAIQLGLQVSAEDVYLHTASFAFSSSVRALMVPLSQGARVCIASYEQTRNPLAIVELIQKQGVTISDTVRSFWEAGLQVLTTLDETAKKALLQSKLRLLVFSGGLLTWNVAKALLKEFENKPRILNVYGQTELIGVSFYPLPAEFEHEVGPVPVGRPLSNTQVYILNSELQSNPAGVTGELHVAKRSLIRGYFNRPELTAEKFISNPFSDDSAEIIYKTGDLARILPDGNLEILGRTDDQVKLRGMRVELGEIEAVLAQHSAVQTTVVLAREDASGSDKRLVAYVIPRQKPAPEVKELRSYLKDQLPEYMVPAAFVYLDAFPLTPNGKLDRNALPAPDETNFESGRSLVEPTDELERQLIKIWEEVLGIHPIGVRDNFFDLGGHSLLAVTLFAQVQKVVGKNFSIATLYQAATVEQQAHLIREEGSAEWSSLVAIQPNGLKPPLFCIHAINGNVLFYDKFARCLDQEQPFYVLQAQGLNGQQLPRTRIEDMAAAYLKEICSVQPEGPYYLGGFSFGGLVAYEIAQQLYTRGQKVALLALFDARGPGYCKQLPPHKRASYQLNKFLRRQVLDRVKNVLRFGPQYVLKRTQEKLQRSSRSAEECKPVLKKSPQLSERPESYKIINAVRKANRQALNNYVPQVYPGKVTLFRAILERPPEGYYFDTQLGWSNVVTGDLEVHEISSSHHWMFKGSPVKIVAEKMKLCLDKAQLNS